MPGFDRSGPRGFGPMTGWGRGLCRAGGVGSRVSYGRGFGFSGMGGRGRRNAGRGIGRGFARGMGPGGAWRAPYVDWEYGPGGQYGYGAPYEVNPQDEAAYLRQEAEAIRGELDKINKRIEELESRDSQS